MTFIRKYLNIVYFVTLFLLLSISDYFSSGNLALLENFLYSLWAVIVYAFIAWVWDSKKRGNK